MVLFGYCQRSFFQTTKFDAQRTEKNPIRRGENSRFPRLRRSNENVAENRQKNRTGEKTKMADFRMRFGDRLHLGFQRNGDRKQRYDDSKVIDSKLNITERDIEEAVLEGATNLNAVQKKLKVGIGSPEVIAEVEQLIRFYAEKYYG